MFRTVTLYIITSFSLYTQQWYMSYRFADSLRAESGQNQSCSQAVSKSVWHTPLLCVHWRTPDDRQMNCLKHVELYSTNKLVHLVGFIVRINGPTSISHIDETAQQHKETSQADISHVLPGNSLCILTTA